MPLDTTDALAQSVSLSSWRHRFVSPSRREVDRGRVSFALPSDPTRDTEPFTFLAQAAETGLNGALVTICGIEGSAPRPLGTHMAVLEDGRYVGHVSGGCVEPAIASEVVQTIAANRDAILRFGEGSCFLDIRFPCGGGVDLLVHVRPEPSLLHAALLRLQQRQAFTLAFDPDNSQASIVDGTQGGGWSQGHYLRPYRPRTRLLLVGRGVELEVMARVASAAEFDVVLASPDADTLRALSDLQVPAQLLTVPTQPWDLPIDAWTATVLLFHEHEWEPSILARAATAEGFYVGALGSSRSHVIRCERLVAMGLAPEQIGRIRGPIGTIGHARDPAVLALSVLSEITVARAELDRA